MNRLPPQFKRCLLSLLIMVGLIAMLPQTASALTVSEVVVDLACPCECPLVLEDCNMSCGLKWKREVGEQINQGKSKQEIIDYFIAKYGDAARLTPMQRLHGKIFQYTRSFDTMDWALLWAGVALWSILMFLGIYFGIRKLLFSHSKET